MKIRNVLYGFVFIISCQNNEQVVEQLNDKNDNTVIYNELNEFGKVIQKCYLKFDEKSFNEYNSLSDDKKKLTCHSDYTQYFHNENGPALITFDHNEKPWRESFYISGIQPINKPHWIDYKNGTKNSEMVYLSDKRSDGLIAEVHYWENGNLSSRLYFYFDKANFYQRVFHNSNGPAYTQYRENGNKQHEVNYIHGKQILCNRWDEYEISRECYKHKNL